MCQIAQYTTHAQYVLLNKVILNSQQSYYYLLEGPSSQFVYKMWIIHRKYFVMMATPYMLRRNDLIKNSNYCSHKLIRYKINNTLFVSQCSLRCDYVMCWLFIVTYSSCDSFTRHCLFAWRLYNVTILSPSFIVFVIDFCRDWH